MCVRVCYPANDSRNTIPRKPTMPAVPVDSSAPPAQVTTTYWHTAASAAKVRDRPQERERGAVAPRPASNWAEVALSERASQSSLHHDPSDALLGSRAQRVSRVKVSGVAQILLRGHANLLAPSVAPDRDDAVEIGAGQQVGLHHLSTRPASGAAAPVDPSIARADNRTLARQMTASCAVIGGRLVAGIG